MLSEAKQRVDMKEATGQGLGSCGGDGTGGFVSYLKTPTVKRKKKKLAEASNLGWGRSF